MKTWNHLSPNLAGEMKAIVPVDCSHPWQPDRGDGTYCNPVLYADYSDPDVVRVGGDFYLVASSFNCTPGLPILHSQDLVNWTLIGHALKNLPHPRYEQVQPGCGVWAPSIRFHAGKYWVFYATPDEGIFVVTAKHPAGPWSEPYCVQEGSGLIDPCPLWDDDGKAYLVHAYAGSRAGIKHRLRVRPMAPDASRLLGEGEIIFHQPEKHPTLEGPKFLKKDGWYYILAPAGGVETGWQVALRSKNIYGPYADKMILSQGDTDINGPHQGALVGTLEQAWWFLHFQDAGIYGRIVHLQPVRWEDGWPLMGKDGEPVRRHAKPTLSARPGWLRLFPQEAAGSLNTQPNLLLQKFPARSFAVETLLEFAPQNTGEEAGLIITGETSAALALERFDSRNRLRLHINGVPTVIKDNVSGAIKLRVTVKDGGLCQFSFDTGEVTATIPQSFLAQKGKWIGAKLGLYSLKRQESTRSGHVDVDYFRFTSMG
jgi:beta-xylosidase